MKPIKSIIAIVVITFLMMGYSMQKPFTEGVLQYDITILSAKNEPTTLNSLNGAVHTLYLKQDASRTEMKSALGTESTVYNAGAGSGFILKEYSGQKLMITLNAANWAQKNQANNSLKFSISNEEITIGTYKCKKATATMADGKLYTVYYDPSLVIANKSYNNALANLPGLPVQYEIKSGNLTFKYTLKSISAEGVPSQKFDAPKTGFRVMSYEENQQLKKG